MRIKKAEKSEDGLTAIQPKKTSLSDTNDTLNCQVRVQNIKFERQSTG